jgi:hypothetical protein
MNSANKAVAPYWGELIAEAGHAIFRPCVRDSAPLIPRADIGLLNCLTADQRRI